MCQSCNSSSNQKAPRAELTEVGIIKKMLVEQNHSRTQSNPCAVDRPSAASRDRCGHSNSHHINGGGHGEFFGLGRLGSGRVHGGQHGRIVALTRRAGLLAFRRHGVLSSRPYEARLISKEALQLERARSKKAAVGVERRSRQGKNFDKGFNERTRKDRF